MANEALHAGRIRSGLAASGTRGSNPFPSSGESVSVHPADAVGQIRGCGASVNPVWDVRKPASRPVFRCHRAGRGRDWPIPACIWLDRVQQGKTRTVLDAMLPRAGPWVSTRSDVILKMGVKRRWETCRTPIIREFALR